MSNLDVDIGVTEFAATVGDVVFRLDGDGRIQGVADRDPPTLGYPQSRLLGESIETVFAVSPPPIRTFDIQTPDAFREAVLDRQTDRLTVPLGAADGTVVPAAVSIVSRDDTDAMICVVRTRSGDHSETGRELYEAIPDPLYVLDAKNRFQRVNEAMVEHTGYERQALLGRTVTELVPSGAADRLRSHLTGLVDASHRSEPVELPIVTADGELYATEAHVTVLTDDSGEYAGSVGVLRDIRERKRREQNLDLLKQIFTRVFRHNIRNRLVVTNGHATILDEQLDEHHRVHTQKIIDSTEQLLAHSTKARLIEQAVTTDDRYEIDLTDSFEPLVADAKETYPDATIDVDLPESFVVRAHAYIDRAIEELLTNAIEHAPTENAQVSIWTDRNTLFIEDESGGLADHELRVLKTGTESDLEHSSGVGLWLVRWLVEYSDSELIVHRTDEGTVMGIRFGDHERDEMQRAPDVTASTVVSAPAHVRDVSLERFRGDPIVERMASLDRLEARYDLLEQAGGQTVLITGEAGIGKTTLVEQFRDRLADRATQPLVATGVCDSDVQPPYHAFRQVLEALPSENELTGLLGDAAAISTANAEKRADRKQALFADIADQLRSVATDRPVVLVVEDMQWADSGTIELFEYLVDEIGRWGHQVMFVGTYRTSDVEQTHPVVSVARKTAETGRGELLELDPFDRDRVRSLLSSLLDISELPSSFVEAVHDHTGGTPLFVTELGHQLARRVGPVQTGNTLPDDLETVTVPETVERAVMDRLDAVPDDVRPVLQLGAVLGTEFSFDLLRVASDYPVDTLIDCIDALDRRRIWTRSAERIEFVHGVVREQTLVTLSEEDRKRLHERVATAIETVHDERIEEYAAQLGSHYEQLGAVDTAYDYYCLAGEYAVETYAHEDAIDHYERALSLADSHDGVTDTEVATVTIHAGEIYRIRGKYDRAKTYFEESLEWARTYEDHGTEAESLCQLGKTAIREDLYDQAREYYERALSLRRDLDDRSGEAECLSMLGQIGLKEAVNEQGRSFYERALSIYRELGDRSGEAQCLNGIASIAIRSGEYDRARTFQKQCLSLCRDVGDPFGEADALNNLAIVAYRQGAYDRFRTYCEESLELSRTLGDREREARTLNNLGNIDVKQGVYDRATEYIERSLEICETIGNREGSARSLVNLGIVACERGAFELASTHCERSLDIRTEIGDRYGQAESHNILARIALRQGAFERATEHFTASLDIAREHDLSVPELMSLRGLGAVARNRGAYDRAAQHLTDSLAVCESEANHQQRAKTQLERARLAVAREDVDSAREMIEYSHETFSELGAVHYEARAQVLRGRIAAATGDPNEARSHWRSAIETFEDLDAPQDTLETIDLLVETCREHGDDDRADEWRDRGVDVFETAPEPVRATYQGWVDDCSSA